MLFDDVLKAATTDEASKFTHKQVKYQDQPKGDQQCDKCWKFLRAVAPQSSQALEDHLVGGLGFSVIHPACLKVQSPISPTGWCKNFERQATVGVEAAPGVAPPVAKQLSFLDALLTGTTVKAPAAKIGKSAVSFQDAMEKWDNTEPRDRKGKWRGRRRTKKAYSPDEARDTQGKWTAVEEAVSTAKDVQRIMDKANLDRAHNTISPETDRNSRRLSTSGLEEWTSGPIELVQEAKDFKPGDEHHDSLTDDERVQHRQQLHEDLAGVRDEISQHTDKLTSGLAAYSRDVDAYASRVKTVLQSVNDRVGKTSKAFDPDEPRDKDGEWTTGGSAGKPSAGPPSAGRGSRMQGYLDNRVASLQTEVNTKQKNVQDLRGKLSVLAAHGASEDQYWGVHQELAQANGDLRESQLRLKDAQDDRDRPLTNIFGAIAGLDLSKTYDPGESRDSKGKWISSDGGPAMLNSSEAEDLVNRITPHEEGLSDKLGDVNQASEKLANISEDTASAEAENEEHEEEHGEVDNALDTAAGEHQAAAAKAAIQLHGRLQALVDAATAARDDIAGAMQEHGLQRVAKAFDPDEPRDDKGRWTSGGGDGGDSHPDYMSGTDARETLDRIYDEKGALSDHVADKIGTAHDNLEAAIMHHEDVAEEEPPGDSKKFDAWNEKNNKAGEAVADAMVEYRDALVQHANLTKSQLANIDADLAQAEEDYGRRGDDVDKAFSPDEPRDARGRWSAGDHIQALNAAGTDHEAFHDVMARAKGMSLGDLRTVAESYANALPGKVTTRAQAYDSIERMFIHRSRFDTKLGKAFNPDEARDEHGMWTSGAAVHPDKIDSDVGKEWHERNEEMHSDLTKSLDNVYEANSKLFDVADKAEDHRSKGDDIYEEHGEDSKQYQAWNKQDDKHMQKTADAAVAVRNALADHIKFATGVLGDMDDDLSIDAERNGHRNQAVGKNAPVVGDVHAATVLGNQNPKRAKDFLTTITELKDGARIVMVPGHEGMSKKDGLYELMLLRHGPTKFNNQTDMSQDRVRSWNDVDLTEEGRETAQKAGEKLAKELDGRKAVLITSDLGRAVETGQIVGKEIGVKATNTPLLRPWNLGKFTGKTTAETYDDILWYVAHPDEVVPGGESFTDFTDRFVKGLRMAIKKAGKKVLVMVSHHRNERWLASWIKAGMPSDLHVDPKEFMKTGEDPGDVATFEIDLKKLGGDQVEKVWGSNGDLPDSVKGNLPDHAQTVFRTVANERMKAGASEVSAIRQAWTAVKNGWKKTKDGTWVRKAADFSSVMKDAYVGDDAGTASLILNNLGDGSAKTPFPYDQNAFSNLRDDQKERFLSCLTDPDQLDVKTVRLSDLSSIQDRVDPGKVQAMRDNPPTKLPVVLRMGSGRYVIADGHHRLSAMHIDGVKTTMVRFKDLEPIDNRVYADGNPGSGGESTDGVERLIDTPPIKKEFTVAKVDQDKQLVFGWASISTMDGEMVIDKQEDMITPQELENAVYDYVLYHRQQGDMHERMGVGRMVESMVFTDEKQEALGCNLGMEGWWIGFKVDDPGVWKRIKNGDLPEFSIGGKAVREEVPA